MKNSILFLLTIMMITSSCVRQEPHWVEGDVREIKKMIYSTDSIIAYFSDDQYISKSVFDYDSLNRKKEEEYYLWQKEKWEKAYKITREYSDDQITYFIYNAMKNEWMLSSKNVSINDSVKNIFIDESYYWENNEWMKSRKIISSYDDNNNLVFQENYLAEGNQWEKFSKLIYAYDKLNKCILEEQYRGKGDRWFPENKYTIVYDTLKNKTIEEIFTGSNEDWKLNKREISYYDKKNNLLQLEKYNLSNNRETKEIKYIYTYDSSNNLTSLESYGNIDNDWSLDKKSVYAYDSNNNRIESTQYNIIYDEEIKDIREISIYNKSNNLTIKEAYFNEDDKWRLGDRIKYTYNSKRHEVVVEKYSLTDQDQWNKTNHIIYALDENNKIKEEYLFYESENGHWKKGGGTSSALATKLSRTFGKMTTLKDGETYIYSSLVLIEDLEGNGIFMEYFKNNDTPEPEVERCVIIYDLKNKKRFEELYRLEDNQWRKDKIIRFN